MIRGCLYIVMLFLALSATAQPTIDFAETKFDFGEFPERQSMAKHNFMFVNNGNQPLIITNVKSTCGCTSPKYTKEPIAAGDTGYIYVTYFATGRPGKFNRAIKVASNASESVKTVYITGNVIRESVEESVKQDIAPPKSVLLKSTHFNLGNITKGGSKTVSIPITNILSSRSHIMVIPNKPYIKGMAMDIEPNKEGSIYITYNSAEADNWGVEDGNITLLVKNAEVDTINLTYYANTVEDFSSLTSTERANAPKINFKQRAINVKGISKIVPTFATLTVGNGGKSPLVIHKISSPSKAITLSASSKTIVAGAGANFKIAIDPTKAKSNIINDYVVIICNDPNNPVQRVQITATIEE